jgi:hypothetical protein
MKKGKLTVTAIWLIVIAAWFGVYKFAQYKVDMYYSTLAPGQLEDDSIYAKLQFHSTANTIITVIFLLVALLLLNRVYKIWFITKSEE